MYLFYLILSFLMMVLIPFLVVYLIIFGQKKGAVSNGATNNTKPN